MSLENDDAAAAAVAVAPRVSLADIEEAIQAVYHINAWDAVMRTYDASEEAAKSPPLNHPLSLLSICLVVLKNGFTVVGKSAPASAANFNKQLGEKLAYEDAVRQIWPLMGFALRCKIHEETKPPYG